MASLRLGAVSVINESWVAFNTSLKVRIGFRSKRFRRVAERWRIRAQHMSAKEHMSKHELSRYAKRSESLRYILKQYGVSIEKFEEDKTSSRLVDLNCEEKHDNVPSSAIYDSKLVTKGSCGFVFGVCLVFQWYYLKEEDPDFH
uniref:Uncharacterized protein n=1 Tax=Noccaea caerulescens TaxID=107243 RepID=A0A1J3J0A4_NOCCA